MIISNNNEICTYCGEELVKKGNVYICPFCGQEYTAEDLEYIHNLAKER